MKTLIAAVLVTISFSATATDDLMGYAQKVVSGSVNHTNQSLQRNDAVGYKLGQQRMTKKQARSSHDRMMQMAQCQQEQAMIARGNKPVKPGTVLVVDGSKYYQKCKTILGRK